MPPPICRSTLYVMARILRRRRRRAIVFVIVAIVAASATDHAVRTSLRVRRPPCVVSARCPTRKEH